MSDYDRSMEYISKTQTLIGEQKRTLVDTATGETIFVDQITKRVYGTKQFWKVYLMDFLTVLGIIDSKQLDIFLYIVENTNQATNTFIGSQRKIATDTNSSLQTVSTIMKKLQNANFVKKVQNGVYMVNPNLLMKGNDHKRQVLLSYYESEEPVDSITYARTKQQALPTAPVPEIAENQALPTPDDIDPDQTTFDDLE